jgi:phosphoribosylcarboxyaminoimidazole (NCAIR) mutase
MGARNAAHLAARILALGDPALAATVRARRQEMSGRVRLPEGFDVSGTGPHEA